jgi:hypothetical protein
LANFRQNGIFLENKCFDRISGVMYVKFLKSYFSPFLGEIVLKMITSDPGGFFG